MLVVYSLYEDLIFILIPSGIPSTEETMSSLLTVIQSSSQSQLGSQQYSECPVSEWNSGGNSTTSATSSNGQVGSVCFLYCFVGPSVRNISESTRPGCWISRADKCLSFMDTCFCSYLNYSTADANQLFTRRHVVDHALIFLHIDLSLLLLYFNVLFLFTFF